MSPDGSIFDFLSFIFRVKLVLYTVLYIKMERLFYKKYLVFFSESQDCIIDILNSILCFSLLSFPEIYNFFYEKAIHLQKESVSFVNVKVQTVNILISLIDIFHILSIDIFIFLSLKIIMRCEIYISKLYCIQFK